MSKSQYRTEIIWPPFKGKACKVVDIATGRSVGLYRTPSGAQRKITQLNAEGATFSRREA